MMRICHFKREYSIRPEYTKEAIRVLKNSPRWVPGQNNGKFVKSWRQIPIQLNISK